MRLRQGRMEDDTVFSDNPLAVAEQWVNSGARRLHLVDLDGAFAGSPRNASVVSAICAEFPEIPVQVGGGIRNTDVAKGYIDAGVSWLIVGTLAVKQPEYVDSLCEIFPDQIIVGLDANNGFVATEGWAEESLTTAVALAQRFEGVGVSAIVYTDISRDGMLQGANCEATGEIADAVSIPVIASGGVTDSADVERLCRLTGKGVIGAIVGRALYEGTLDLTSAQHLADNIEAVLEA